MSGWVQVYQRTDRLLYISSSSHNMEGWTVANGWCKAVSIDVPDGQLGALIQEGLRRGDDPVDVSVEESEKFLRPILKEANVKSYTAFAKDTLSVGIERDAGGAYVIVPTRNRNRRGSGFLYLPEKQMTISPDASVDEIGSATRSGLDLSIVSESKSRK
ncbi:hypothetical protein [Cryptosporangium aurantiacum]|uniref:Uncharacterized protein n=1 Tax=Cryptosporangium aurantiacum TaxID=134849 RepID=A0A1M7RLS9_9ACTN|nr:hypothetical protein [Cryptosporangium aurantiacum]SHN47048.1 hypothetical protein SAMN05443668_1204 [Cryptosporangium aurantiacum]